MNKREIPQIIKDVGFDFNWSEEKVWALDIPTEKMPIEQLTWHFDVPFWWKPEGFYDLTPNEVMKYPTKYQRESDRIKKADLTYPLDIMWWKERWLLLDGLHRLVKAYLNNMKEVDVRKIPVESIPSIVK